MRALLTAAIFLSAVPAQARAQVADIIYYNGSIETMSPKAQHARALAVRSGRILAVSLDEKTLISLHRGKITKMINLGGRALLPGFVDPHTHVWNEHDAVGMTLGEMQELVLAHGITTVGNAWAREGFLDEMRAFRDSGQLFVRTSLYLTAGVNACGEPVDDWWRTVLPITDPEAMLRIPGVKIYTDGGSCGWGASTYPVTDDDHEDPYYGDLYFLGAQLDGLVAEAHARGFQVLMHSIGDRSRDLAIHAIAQLGEVGNPRRHRIDHNSVVRPDQVSSYRSAGIVPVAWGWNSTCAQNNGVSYFNTLPAGSESWWSPVRTMLGTGLRVAWHLDWYSALPLSRLDTSLVLWSLVTRRAIASDGSICEPQPAVAAETVSPLQALTMATRNAAYALGMESVVGSLEVGKLADLIVLDRDPLAVAEDDLKDLVVLSTVVGGVTRMCSAAAAGLCP